MRQAASSRTLLRAGNSDIPLPGEGARGSLVRATLAGRLARPTGRGFVWHNDGVVRVLALVVVAAAVLLTVASAWGASDKRQPILRLVDMQPLALSGSSFAPAERVRLRVSSEGATVLRTVRATASGRIAATFELAWDRCNGDLVASAAGSSGSRAVLKRTQLQCPMP